MGVWHISGLGLNPGAITVPLTYLYILLKAATKGDQKALKFFETSGESNQELKGAPEALVIFTSKEVIEGKERGKPRNEKITDNWFRSKFIKSTPITLCNYLEKLFNSIQDEDFATFYDNEWIKEINLIQVDFQDFNKCFPISYITINALKKKEIWINMVGGSNPINSSLILSAGFVEVNAKIYYVFEPDVSYLHPSIPRPDFNNPNTDLLISKLNLFPFFSLDIGKLTRRINERFDNRGEILNVKEIEMILEELRLPNQYVAKLIAGGWVRIENEKVKRGEMLRRWNRFFENVRTFPENYSDWKKWAIQEKILWQFKDGGFQQTKF